MSFRSNTLHSEKINFIEEQEAVNSLRKLSQYIIYAGVGILGGAMGVACRNYYGDSHPIIITTSNYFFA